MNKISYCFNILLVLLIGISACKAPSTLINDIKYKPLPTYYENDTSATNSADVNWRTFYNDTTLTTLIDTALVNNFDVLKMQQRLEMSNAQILYANGQLRPYTSVMTNLGLQRFGKYTMDGVGNYDTGFSTNISNEQKIPEYLPKFDWGIQSSWEIDIYHKLRNRRKAAIARFWATKEGKNILTTNLIAEIASTYYNLIAADLKLDFIRETVNLQRNQLEVIKIEKEAGRTTELAVQQFEAQLLDVLSLEKEIIQQIVFAENRINFLLGRYPQPIFRDKNAFMQLLPPYIYAGVPSDILRNRPDIRQAEQELAATKADLEAARAAFLPSFNIGSIVGFQTFNPKFIINPQSLAFNIIGGLVTPVLNKSAIKSYFNTNKAIQIEAIYNYQQNILNGYIEVYNQLFLINNLKETYTLKVEEARMLLKAVETASQLYLTGRSSYLEILINRQNAIKVNLELIEIKLRQYDSIVYMYKALGGGWK